MKRQKLSKIDVAILRRKEKKLRRQKLKKDNQRECDIFVDEDKEDSDCSGSDGDEEIEIDLCIKSGPACKLNLDSKKMKFLEVFRLTTHLRQNSIEMQKLVRRKWVMPDVIQEEESTEIPILNLPISKKSLLVMSRMQNPQQKNFLQVLGLETVAADRKEEMEEIWERVVEERLRRKCESSLTKYYQKVFKAIAAEKEVQNISNCINQKTFLALPIVQQYKNQHLVTQNRDNTPFVLRKCPIQKLRSNGQKYNSVRTGNIPYGLPSEENRNLGVLLKLPKSYKLSHCRTEDDCGSVSVISPDDKPISIHPKASTLQDLSRLKNKHFIKDKSENDKLENLPLKMIIVDTQCQNDRISMSESNPLKEDSDAAVKPKFSWPGLMEIKQAYERYSQERFREMVDFKKQHCILANETLKKQAEVKFLERKQRNLHTTLFRAEREKKELLRTIDQLTNFIKKIR
ncbi:hypothetical protein JTB14_014574 [Gonioctena quinquepunctata]|nr:hypothetical protein JTB14_014574 [Gonioctena quinquepunctata]